MEVHEHIALADYLRLRGFLFAHTPNEGKRNLKTGKLLKRMGMSAGVPDFLIFEKGILVPCAGVAIEVKWNKKKPTENQQYWLDELSKRGWLTRVVHSFEEAVAFLEEVYGKAR